MKRFTDAGRVAIAAKNWYAALSLALTIPDICGSLEDPGPNKSRKRYVRWCKQWLEPKYARSVGPSYAPMTVKFLSAEECYDLRCSLIHSGSGIAASVSAAFFDDTAGSHCNRMGGILQLKAENFCHDMFDAADQWDAATAGDSAIQGEKGRLLTIHAAGARIGSVTFG